MDTSGITELIATLAAKNASGRLDVIAGGNEGTLLFNHGKLIDARIGHLIGFQAINALASMRDARFHFDPSVPVPAVSSITPSERLVLKQFFGIETADSHVQPLPPPVAEVNEATVIRTSAPSEVIDDEPTEVVAAVYAKPAARYLTVLTLAVLLIAVGVAAVMLRGKFRERNSAATVAARTEPVAPDVPAQPVVTEEPSVAAHVNEKPRASEEPRANEVPSANEQPRANEVPRASEEPRANEAPRTKEEPRATEAPRVANEPRVNETTASATTPDLNGQWTVVNTVNTTSYKSFQNLRVGFALSINQNGTTFTARGQKVSENGRRLPANSRTPIELKGVINGDRIEATFYEQGTARKTNGRFVWKIDRKGAGLTGTFDSTAARTSGKSVATREL